MSRRHAASTNELADMNRQLEAAVKALMAELRELKEQKIASRYVRKQRIAEMFALVLYHN